MISAYEVAAIFKLTDEFILRLARDRSLSKRLLGLGAFFLLRRAPFGRSPRACVL